MLGNLIVNIGRIRFSSTSNNEEAELTIIIIIVVISIIIASLAMLIVIGGVFKRVRGYCHCSSSKSVTDEVVNMYASPAYGTHQVYTEPGLDHLYETIDDKRCEESTLQAATEEGGIDVDGLRITTSCEVDAETDADGHLKMKSCSDNQALTGDNADTQQAIIIGKPKLTLPNDGRLNANMSEAGCNQREAQPNDSSPQQSEYENKDEDASAAAPYLEVFNDQVDQKFTSNVTLA